MAWPTMSMWEGSLNQTQETLDRLYLLAVLGNLGIFPTELVEVAGENILTSFLKLLLRDPDPDKQKTMR